MGIIDRLIFAVIGAAIAWVFQQYRLARSEDIALINEHIKDIERLSDAAQAYWLAQPETALDDLKLSAKVRANHAATTLLYEHVSKICERTSDTYKSLFGELFSISTGGTFESSGREIDPGRAVQTSDVSARLVHHLRLERSDIASLRRLWRTFKRETQRRLAELLS